MPRSPKSWNDFIGQGALIRRLKALIGGARASGQPCPSLVLAGQSGMGKTGIANAIAAACGTVLHYLQATPDTDAKVIERARIPTDGSRLGTVYSRSMSRGRRGILLQTKLRSALGKGHRAGR